LHADSVGVATALSPATVGHFKFLFHQLFVGLGLSLLFPIRRTSNWPGGDLCVEVWQKLKRLSHLHP
jgi:hypothetical protein